MAKGTGRRARLSCRVPCYALPDDRKAKLLENAVRCVTDLRQAVNSAMHPKGFPA